MKFTVSRRRWARGGGGASLRNADGRQCCLGFVARQCGCKVKDIFDCAMPSHIVEPTAKLKEVCLMAYCYNRPWVVDAAYINDDSRLIDKEREAKLRTIFKAAGHQLVFKP